MLYEPYSLIYLFLTEGDSKLSNDQQQLQDYFSLTAGQLLLAKEVVWKHYENASDDFYHNRNQLDIHSFEKCCQDVIATFKVSSEDFSSWLRKWKEEERVYRSEWLDTRSLDGMVSIYATQFNAETSNEVALPDKYLKFATRGWTSDIPEKLRQYYNSKFAVNLSRGNKSLTSVPVNDVGPWNTNDNYWDTSGAANPRRRFIDLAQYKPEAQAAYYSDYNDGEDENGRAVLTPAGIDLSRAVASSLGFSSYGSGWIYVDFSSLA